MTDDFKGSELTLACAVLREAMIPADVGTKMIAAEAIEFMARETGDTLQAADRMKNLILAAKRNGERVNRFWFTDQKYLDTGPPNPGVYRGPSAVDEQARKDKLAEDYAMWCSMSLKYRNAHPWPQEVGK